MKTFSAFAFLLTFGGLLVAAHADSPKPFLRGLETQSAVLCRIMRIDVQYMPTDTADETDDGAGSNDEPAVPDESYVCVTDTDDGATDMSFAIDLDDDILKQLDLQEDSTSWVSISSAVIDYANAAISILPDAQVTAVQGMASRRRKLAPSIGTSTVLVLRVTYRGTEPSLSAAELASSVFGLGQQAADVSLASQMEACSFGKLVMEPAEGAFIVNGVAEISITERVSGQNSVRALENLVVDKANRQFGTLSAQYEHVVLVMPDDNSLVYGGNGFLAYAFLRGYVSVFHDLWAGRISALAHEVGHNLNLHHAGHNGLEYGDESGYMGFGSLDEQSPLSCFNAQKHWSLGWFHNRAVSLDVADLPWAGYVAAFTDYNMTTPDQCVLVNVGRSDPRLFLQYNRAKGINAETRELGDQIVIVKDDGSQDTYEGLVSWRQGGIARDQDGVRPVFRYKDFGGPDVDLFIKVCETVSGPPDQPDYMRLSIHLDDGVQGFTCQDEIPTMDALCDDDLTASFLVEGKGMRTCIWLARNVSSTQRLCFVRGCCRSD